MSRYDREMVERLIPAVWDRYFAYGVRDPRAPDPDMPRSKPNPKTGNTLYAHLADIKAGWASAPLTHKQRRALFMRFALDETHAEIARREGVARKVITVRIEAGVGHIVDHLNGETLDSETDWSDETVD